MYYMVYYETSHGHSSPPDIECADFDELDEARGFMQGLIDKNMLKRAAYGKRGHGLLDRYDHIRLCIGLDGAGY